MTDKPPIDFTREIGLVMVAVMFTFLALWGCDTTTGCLGDFQTKLYNKIVPAASAVDLGPGEETTVRCVVPPTPTSPPSTPAPPPEPTPAPEPTAPPTPAPTVAPVICSKTAGTATEAQAAVNSAVTGQTVCIEEDVDFPGTFYMKSGVRATCLMGVTLTFDGGNQEGVRFNTNVSGAQIDSCEITGGWDGVKVTGDNNIVRDNYIHGNKYQGVLVTAASNNVIENNVIEKNGTSCILDPQVGESPRHCHDVYLSNPNNYCKPMTGNRVVNNLLGPIGGAAVNINSDPCRTEGIRNTVITGNEVVNANMCVALYYGTSGTVIHNNICTILNPYPSNLPSGMKYGIQSWGAPAGEPSMSNNSFILRSDYEEYIKH